MDLKSNRDSRGFNELKESKTPETKTGVYSEINGKQVSQEIIEKANMYVQEKYSNNSEWFQLMIKNRTITRLHFEQQTEFNWLLLLALCALVCITVANIGADKSISNDFYRMIIKLYTYLLFMPASVIIAMHLIINPMKTKTIDWSKHVKKENENSWIILGKRFAINCINAELIKGTLKEEYLLLYMLIYMVRQRV